MNILDKIKNIFNKKPLPDIEPSDYIECCIYDQYLKEHIRRLKMLNEQNKTHTQD